MIYALNIFELCKYLIPKTMRKNKHKAWLKAMLRPLQSAINIFYDYAQKTRYELSFNGQQVYLEHLLNDKFDFAQRRIFISDPVISPYSSPYIYNKSETNLNIVIYNKSENKPPIYFINKSESVGFDDFIINVPLSIYNVNIDVLIKNLTAKYKLCDKKFSIKTF